MADRLYLLNPDWFDDQGGPWYCPPGARIEGVLGLYPRLRERRHAASNGVLVVSFAMDKRGKIVSDIDVRGIGLPGDADRPLGDILDDLAERAERAVRGLKGEALDDELVVEQAVSRALKKASQQVWDRRPIVETVILRL